MYGKCLSVGLIFVLFCCCAEAAEDGWSIKGGRITTRWAKDVSPDNVHVEYPRPQMVRKDWLNLNGLWEYAITSKNAGQPKVFDGKILVPFAAESALSGVAKAVSPDERLWYRRKFTVPESWTARRIMLNFGAVDFHAIVRINGIKVGEHRGGYDPFSFDITNALIMQDRAGDRPGQEIVVSVWDPTNAGKQPRGKQVSKPRGIWYTAVTGIWQTVWLEPVPKAHIVSLKISPDIDNNCVRLRIQPFGVDPETHMAQKFFVRATVFEGNKKIAAETGHFFGKGLKLKIDKPRLWSPDDPYLYDLVIELLQEGDLVDSARSYFGMRKIEMKKDEAGVNRLFLNNEALFQYGPLDQGWWPDGLYTAASDEALRYDIVALKRLGCNMMRKHVKIEPDRLYYWCDKLGLMVWQDMPSGDKSIGRKNGSDLERSEQSARQFELELKRMIDTFGNHPSIVMWVVFNEGWGQYDTARLTKWVKNYDRSRLVNSASGWKDRGTGDVHDIHSYPGPAAPANEAGRAAVLGEFGGLGLPVKGHTWQDEKNWGYRSFTTREKLTEAYVSLLGRLRPMIYEGLSAAVYTQTSDVEIEVNGLMTYDRAIVKMDEKQAAEAARKLFLPPPVVETIVPTSR